MDVSSNGKHGTLINGPTWGPTERGVGLGFDGASNQSVSIVGDFSVLVPDMTLAVGITPDDVTTDQYISDFAGINEFAVILGFQDGKYNVYGQGYATGTAADTQITASGVGVYDLLVWTKQGTSLKGYLNGVLIVSVLITEGDWEPSSALKIGGQYNTEGTWHVYATLDLYTLWSRALAPSEILWLYEKPNTLTTPPSTMTVFSVAASGGAPPAVGNPWYYYAQQQAVAS